MSEISKNLPESSEESTYVHDPVIQIKLSELARVHADAEYFADLVSQYVRIRNSLARELNQLNKLIDHRANEAADMRNRIYTLELSVKELIEENERLTKQLQSQQGFCIELPSTGVYGFGPHT